MKDEFRTFEKMEIPYCHNTIGFIQCCWIFVIRGNTEFWILTITSEISRHGYIKLPSETSQYLLSTGFSHISHPRTHTPSLHAFLPNHRCFRIRMVMKTTRITLPSGFRTDSVITNIIITVVQSPLNDLR